MAVCEDDGAFNCEIRLRESPIQRKNAVRIGCGAGFAGDRPAAALKLLKRVPNMHYMVLECLAERTFAERVEAKAAGGKGYDPRISEWMTVLLPVAVENRVCLITNMGGVDPLGAQEEVLKTSSNLGIIVSVAVAYEYPSSTTGASTYLGAAPIVKVLEEGKPHVIITSRLADAALFLGPMIYELGWNWNDYAELAQGTLAGHLLECGCQLTGGYYVHPADPFRNLSRSQVLDISLPYADIFRNGKVILAKAEDSGGEISVATCTEQLLYEIEDPSSYITPDVIINLRNVTFKPLTKDSVLATGAQPHPNQSPKMLLRLVPSTCGWKGWGEISYGGSCCRERAALSDQLVRSWMEEAFPGIGNRILSYAIGKDSLFVASEDSKHCQEVRLRLDGLFDSEEQATRLVREFTALYTNGPAGGGGISSGIRKETLLKKEMVPRAEVLWKISFSGFSDTLEDSNSYEEPEDTESHRFNDDALFCFGDTPHSPPAGVRIPLYQIAHSRTGDKGDTLNFSLIPHCPGDITRLQQVITAHWVRSVMAAQFHHQMRNSNRDEAIKQLELSIYMVEGVHALNVVVKNVLDGGVTCSRKIDRHGKTLSDLVLSQVVTLP